LTLAKRPIFLVFAMILLGLGILILPTLQLVPSVYASSRTITLIGFIAAWNNTGTPNPTITVTQGDTITIQLSSGDGAPHRFFVDADNNGATPDCPGADICSNTFPPSTTVSFTVNIAPGTYTYYCSIHPTTMLGQFVVQGPTSQDFAISANPASLNVTQGSTGSTTITLTSLNGFSGTLTLTETVSPTGPIASFSPRSVTLSSGRTATSTLTVSAVGEPYSSVATGNYSVSVTASNGTLPHSMTVQVRVGPSNSSPSGSANLPLTVLVGTAVVAIAAVAVTIFVVRRKSK